MNFAEMYKSNKSDNGRRLSVEPLCVIEWGSTLANKAYIIQ